MTRSAGTPTRTTAASAATDLLHQARRANTALRPRTAERALRRALRTLDSVEHEPADASGEDLRQLRGRIHVTLAYAVSEQGRVVEAHEHLDTAGGLLGPSGALVVHGQRAIILRRTGRDDLALAEYDAALTAVGPASDSVDVARVLLNRAVLHLAAARPSQARADLARSARLAGAAGGTVIGAKARHDLALVDLLRGDVPAALRAFADTERAYATAAPGLLPTLSLDRARALLGVGLLAEAERDLAVAVAGLRAQRVTQDLAEALLTSAECRAALGDPAGARRAARQARAVLAGRDNPRWLARVDLLLARLRSRSGSPQTRANALRSLADRLTVLGLGEESRLADYEAARVDPAGSQTLPAPRRTDHLETRLAWRQARAERDLAAGRRATGLAELRSGLHTLDSARARLASPDLRAGTAALGRGLAERGLREAVRTGRPAEVFAWAERSRAQALRHPPVVPPEDPDRAALLAELRSIRAALLSAGAGGVASDLRRRARELEAGLSRWHWEADGVDGTGRQVPLGEVRSRLGDRQVLVVQLEVEGQSLALAVTSRAATVVRLGDAPAELTRRLRSTLDVLAGRELPDRLRRTLEDSLAREAATLDAALLKPLRSVVGDRDLVVVPTGELAMVPWSVLPATRGRPVTVTPSATLWATGVPGRSGAVAAHAGSTLLVQGPGLLRADAEIDALAALHPHATILRGDAATPASVLAALPQVATAHIAAHGTHNAEHPAFSGIELSGGPLMGHDLAHLSALPDLVVLSACDLGRHEPRPGGESLGMTTSLLAAGARTVVAGVCRAGDDDSATVMTAFHRALAVGAGPAAALAEATTASGRAHPFVCFGHGG